MNKIYIKKIVSSLCTLFLLLYTSSVRANDTEIDTSLTLETKSGVVTQVKKGDKAPFDGVLLSPVAAAKMYGELKFFEEECKLTLSKELNIQKIRYDADISSLRLKLDVETERTEKLLEIKDRRIEFLEKNWRPSPWYESGEFWVAVGIVSGVLLTVGSAYAVGQVSK